MRIPKHWCYYFVHNGSPRKMSGPNYKMYKNESKTKFEQLGARYQIPQHQLTFVAFLRTEDTFSTRILRKDVVIIKIYK